MAPLSQTDDWPSEHIFVPSGERGRAIGILPASVRLSHIFKDANIQLLGDLHGKTYLELGRYRNCGRKTLRELYCLVRDIQSGNSQHSLTTGEPSRDPNTLLVTKASRDLVLSELPMSVRLENVLRTRGYKTVGDLNGSDVRDILSERNCGRKTIQELKKLLKRVEEGEFSSDLETSALKPLRTVIRLIRAGANSIDKRNHEILNQRLFGRKGEPKTLEEVGKRFGMTRERVRQIVKAAFEKIRRSGGPVLARALELLSDEHNKSVSPLTASSITAELSSESQDTEWPELFYLHIIDQIAPSIPVWGPEIGWESHSGPKIAQINLILEDWLRAKGAYPTAKDAFEHLRESTEIKDLSVPELFSALRRARNIILDFAQPGEPRLRLRRLRLFDVALPILIESPEPLTPEAIIEKARSRFGADSLILAVRTTENALGRHPKIFRLGPRAFGLRQHFASSEADWPRLRAQFVELLQKENRPISSIEVCEKRSIPLPKLINSYELAEILREDTHLVDLGRRLFGLAKWGVEEREHIKDLLPQILAQADRPLTVSELYERLTKFRSATPTGLSNVLREHPRIVRLGFEHYGLRRWGDSRKDFFVTKRSIVEKAVRRTDPPITFSELCNIFGIPAQGRSADILWKSCAGSEKLRRAPDRRAEDTLLMHKVVSLEQALASIVRTVARPMHSYELEWELRARFGELFPKIKLRQIEERLDKSQRFVRNVDGTFVLDADLDFGEFDINAIRAVAAELTRRHREILSSDELLERLESEGFDLQGMTRGMLTSVLRGSEELEQVGQERFRAK
jgi:Sigma-70, region 4/Bacterial RNA polymerase, alpha chain C terminal domain